MKKFIEKLIGRLEEVAIETLGINKSQFAMDKGEYSSYCSLSLYDVKEQANQLAKEYEQTIDVAELVEKFGQEKAQSNDGWIPCSERLPEVEADVLLSLRSLDVYTGFRANEEGCFYVEGEGYVELENVLAYKPLPEPYRGE